MLLAWHTVASCGLDISEDAGKRPSWLDHILTGASHLQSAGQKSTRPLNRDLIFRVLVRCEVVDAVSVARAIARDYERSQVDRYTAAARVASKAVEAHLARRPQQMQLLQRDASDLSEFGFPEVH